METLTRLTQRAQQTKQSIEAEKTRYQDAMRGLTDDLADVQREIEQHVAGLDCERIMHAEHVISIRGSWNRRGEEGGSCVKDAIADLTMNGGAKLAREYFGVKNYDRWTGQRCDCEYGCGPRHGHIVFAVKLTDVVRKRLRNGGELTTEEIEAALYYLHNIDAIAKARKEAAAVSQVS